MSSFISLSLSLSVYLNPRATKETRISHLASLEYGLTSSPPPPMLSLLGASPYPPPAPPAELVEFPPRLLRLIANNFVVVSFMSPSFASNTDRTTIGSKSGNMSSSVRHAASNDGPSLIFFSFGSQGRLLTYFVGKSLSLFVQKQERQRETERETREKKLLPSFLFFLFCDGVLFSKRFSAYTETRFREHTAPSLLSTHVLYIQLVGFLKHRCPLLLLLLMKRRR